MRALRRTVLVVALAVLTGCGAAAAGHSHVAAKRSAEGPLPASATHPVAAAGSRARTTLISVSRFGDQGDGDSADPSLSADGRFVAFISGSDDLVPGDTNGSDDVFVRDTRTGVTTRINVSPTGASGNGIRIAPASVSIDADGRLVAFQTDDTNLVPRSANTCMVYRPGIQPCTGIFVRDLRSGITRVVNVSDNGTLANGPSQFPVISADGRYVAFLSGASNLVPGDTNNAADLFVVDLKTSVIQRVSLSSTGAQANSGIYSFGISANGKYVAFNSEATTLAPGKPSKNVVGIFFRDLQTGKTQLVGIYGTVYEDFYGSVSISPDGRYVSFDSDGVRDTLVRDMQTGNVQQLGALTGLTSSGISSWPVFDAKGRYVAFSFAPTGPASGNAHAGILVRDLVARRTQPVSVSTRGEPTSAIEEAISADGRYVAFSSSQSDLPAAEILPGPAIFLRGPLH